jgi:hypothetical protein
MVPIDIIAFSLIVDTAKIVINYRNMFFFLATCLGVSYSLTFQGTCSLASRRYID